MTANHATSALREKRGPVLEVARLVGSEQTLLQRMRIKGGIFRSGSYTAKW